MNENTFEKLEYSKLKEIIKSYCVSGLGIKLLDELMPSIDIDIVNKRLKETSEAKQILNMFGQPPLAGISDIEKIVEKINKRIILIPIEIVKMADCLRASRKTKVFMENKNFLMPSIYEYSKTLFDFKCIEDEIYNSIDGNKINSRASKKLVKIRRSIEEKEEKIKSEIEKFLKNKSNANYIQEFFIVKKDDRYTIAIKSEYKNKVPGKIVDISSKGSSVFIEPKNVGKVNEQLILLKMEESIEEYQVISNLTDMLLENIYKIDFNIKVMAKYDMIFAKAKFSKEIGGIQPDINDWGYTKIIDGKHPLLKGDIVGLDFEIGNDFRSLVITGPNAGGKTIVLKTIGILTLSIMSGFHISCKEGSHISIFNNIYVDIGDNQNMENSLSTFSSHMKNIADIIINSNNSCLILLDEIGTGTEPNEGAGLAISILEELYHNGSISVVTTHYGEIKRFSEIHMGFMNAAMAFNNETLSPMYKLIIGKSGNSNAIWISRKMKIDEKILERAKIYIENKDYNLELIDYNKIKKPKLNIQEINSKKNYDFKKGDRVKIKKKEDFGIVYESVDSKGMLTILYNKEFINELIDNVILDIKASDLYPIGYDMNVLFKCGNISKN